MEGKSCDETDSVYEVNFAYLLFTGKCNCDLSTESLLMLLSTYKLGSDGEQT